MRRFVVLAAVTFCGCGSEAKVDPNARLQTGERVFLIATYETDAVGLWTNGIPTPIAIGTEAKVVSDDEKIDDKEGSGRREVLVNIASGPLEGRTGKVKREECKLTK